MDLNELYLRRHYADRKIDELKEAIEIWESLIAKCTPSFEEGKGGSGGSRIEQFTALIVDAKAEIEAKRQEVEYLDKSIDTICSRLPKNNTRYC